MRDFEVLKRFARRAEVTLYVGRYSGFVDRIEEGVRIRGLGFGNRNWLCRLTYALHANLRILFDRSDHIGMSPSVYAPVLAGLLRGKRHYMVFHLQVGKRALQKYGPFGVIPWLCEQATFRCVRRCLAVNGTLVETIRRVNPNADAVQTANGFDPALLDLPVTVAAPPFILYLGRADMYMKGIDLLIPAWADALSGRGVDLVLAMRGDEVERIRGLIPPAFRDRVRLEVDPPPDRKTELLSSCLFFVSPSRFEGFGIAALEANAAGKAVLATDNEGFRDSMDPGETALLVPVEDAAALKAGMLRLLEDADLREAMGRKGRERARNFSWDKIAEKEWAWVSSMSPAGSPRRTFP